MRIRQTAASFEMLLRRWLDTPEAQRAAVADEIRKVFEEPLAIFVLDMSGFSSSVARHGVVHFLAMIQRMRELVVPAVNRNGGELVKYIGDDVLAVFDDADEAYAAAREVGEIVAIQNRDLAESLQIRVAIGIGYGPTLFVPGVDIWGDEATLAFKLGEDTAGPSEVLFTEAAYVNLSEPPRDLQRLDLDLTGRRVRAYAAKLPR